MKIKPYEVEIDDKAKLFLVFDKKLPSKTSLKKFIKWLLLDTNDTFKDIKNTIERYTWYSTIVTTKKGYDKLYFTDNIPCVNIQTAYDEFRKPSK